MTLQKVTIRHNDSVITGIISTGHRVFGDTGTEIASTGGGDHATTALGARGAGRIEPGSGELSFETAQYKQ